MKDTPQPTIDPKQQQRKGERIDCVQLFAEGQDPSVPDQTVAGGTAACGKQELDAEEGPTESPSAPNNGPEVFAERENDGQRLQQQVKAEMLDESAGDQRHVHVEDQKLIVQAAGGV